MNNLQPWQIVWRTGYGRVIRIDHQRELLRWLDRPEYRQCICSSGVYERHPVRNDVVWSCCPEVFGVFATGDITTPDEISAYYTRIVSDCETSHRQQAKWIEDCPVYRSPAAVFSEWWIYSGSNKYAALASEVRLSIAILEASFEQVVPMEF